MDNADEILNEIADEANTEMDNFCNQVEEELFAMMAIIAENAGRIADSTWASNHVMNKGTTRVDSHDDPLTRRVGNLNSTLNFITAVIFDGLNRAHNPLMYEFMRPMIIHGNMHQMGMTTPEGCVEFHEKLGEHIRSAGFIDESHYEYVLTIASILANEDIRGRILDEVDKESHENN